MSPILLGLAVMCWRVRQRPVSRANIVFGGAEHPARLFAVIVGKVATGRKGTATGAAQRLFEAADPRWAKRINPGLKSPEAMLDRVDDNGSDTRLPRADNDAVANLWARGEVQVVRLAAAYAIGTASDTVTAEHVDAAVAVWRYCAESAEALFGIAAGPEDGAGDRAARRKVLEYLLRCAGKAGGWVTQTQLNKAAFQGNARRGEVAHVLKYLVDKGYVEYRATPTRGRPKHEYRLPPRVANGLTEKSQPKEEPPMDTGKEDRPIELPVPVVPEQVPVPEKTPAAEPEKVPAP